MTDGAPRKSREELIAIFQERQKELSIALQKQAIESALAPILPKLRNDSREELVDERLKLQATRRLGIDVGDDEVRSLIDAVAARNKMICEEFAQHLKSRGVDATTMIDKLRAQKAWDETIKRRKAN